MLITNNPAIAEEADRAGVDRIFLDFEILGKYERQGHLDTHIAQHNLEDIGKIKNVVTRSKIISRINPLNKNTKKEIEKVIKYGTDIVMLPMYRNAEEVEKFVGYVGGRAKTCLLLETAQAMVRIDDTLEVGGIDEIHIGLNDLHLSLGLDFMFEPLSGGIVEYLGNKIRNKKIRWGFGGIAQIGEGILPAEFIIGEHIRLGSEMAILSRTFKNKNKNLAGETKKIRERINESKKWDIAKLRKNKMNVRILVNGIVNELKKSGKPIFSPASTESHNHN